MRSERPIPILEWVAKYLAKLPPKLAGGGSRGGQCHTSLDVYGTEGTKRAKAPVPSNTKIREAYLQKGLIHMRRNPPKFTKGGTLIPCWKQP